MRFRNLIRRRASWISLPSSILAVLLQRTPALRLATAAGEFLAGSPAGAILRSAVGAVAALGALDSLAGATQYSLTTNVPSPDKVPTNAAISKVVFGVSPIAQDPAYWKIGGSIPPGLSISAGSNVLTSQTGPGTIFGAFPVLQGTPVTAGAFPITLQAFLDGATSSPVFPYTISVTGSSVVAPVVTTQPQTQTATAGNPVNFSVGATGTSLSFQWSFNGVAIPGATGPTFTIPSAQTSNDGSYMVLVSNSAGTVNSGTAILTVNASSAPVFTVQPATMTVAANSTAVFNAIASASPAPSYQWLLNNSAIPGANLSALVIGNATAADVGVYSCMASNSAGSTTSSGAALNVVATANPGRLINIATRASVGTGANALIAGFVIGGAGTSGAKPVLIRASGPALSSFLSGTLPDPSLSLFASGGANSLQSDTGWGGNPAISAEAAAVGAFAWSTSPVGADSALYLNGPTALASGGYTAQIAGSSGDSGVALAEVYDATPAGSFTGATPRLINLASRGLVGTGGNIMIAGFVIGGSTSKTVLIRASGPAISSFVAGALPDPQLQLFGTSGGTSSLLASNSGWGGAAPIVSAAASVGAFAWTNLLSADSALLFTLPPGAYSAQVSGASGDTGLSLIEVYEVP